jgi:hypothetical protein
MNRSIGSVLDNLELVGWSVKCFCGFMSFVCWASAIVVNLNMVVIA